MVITQPTIDDFSDTTVMRVIRKIVNYICSDSGLVAQINDNDITGFTSSYKNNILKIDATKGDGSKLPVCNVTIEGGGSSTGNPYPTAVSGTVGVDGNIKFTITMSSGSPLTTTINMNYFASADDLSDLQKQVSGIKPAVTINENVTPPTITVAINGKSSTANLPSSKGNVTIENFQASNISTIISKLKSIPLGSIVLINVFNFGATSGAGTITYCSAFKVDSGGAFSANGALFYTSKSYPLTAFYVGSSNISIKYIDAENSEETLTWNSSSSFSSTIISFK